MRHSIWLCLLVVAVLGCNSPETEPATKPTEEASKNVIPADTDLSTSTADVAKDEPKFEFNNVHFEAPTLVAFGGDKNFKHSLYPSPAMFDVDNDGDIELVLGDLPGRLIYSENENTGSGDPVWSTPKPVEYYNGEAINMSNW